MLDRPDTRYFRTLFLSDLHLGAKASQAEAFADFLRHHDAETIYLVGDFFDGWRLQRDWHWPKSHNDVVMLLLAKARAGTKIILLPGNHDSFLREFEGFQFNNVTITDRIVHETADGQRYLVIHGDQFDSVAQHAPWLAGIGDLAYRAALSLNGVINRVRRHYGLTPWSFSAWAKHKVKMMVNEASDFEELLAAEARRVGADGVICGHIHHAAMQDFLGIRYVNTGDWVESRTAVTEDSHGRLELVEWHGVTEEAGIGNPTEAETDQEPRLATW
jgi:UDP-2,3-diacylglucosamine pyrophosphatase LpxH